MVEKHPRDMFITIFGRKPVLEAVLNKDLAIDKILISKNAQGGIIENIIKEAQKRDILIKRVGSKEVSRISKKPKQDQGIVVDVIAPNMYDLDSFLFSLNSNNSCNIMALDGVTTPSNVGMIIRSCVAAGFDGVLIPRKGVADINPLVVKASAGVVFKGNLLKCENIKGGLLKLKNAGFSLFGLSGTAKNNLFTFNFARKAAFILGSESKGMSSEIRNLIDYYISIPMENNVESLNVACAATIVGYEMLRRKFL